jgi:hypothetical protein
LLESCSSRNLATAVLAGTATRIGRSRSMVERKWFTQVHQSPGLYILHGSESFFQLWRINKASLATTRNTNLSFCATGTNDSAFAPSCGYQQLQIKTYQSVRQFICILSSRPKESIAGTSRIDGLKGNCVVDNTKIATYTVS